MLDQTDAEVRDLIAEYGLKLDPSLRVVLASIGYHLSDFEDPYSRSKAIALLHSWMAAV
jgi:hypothetical protein